MSDGCEYAELRRRAEDAEFDLVTMTRVRDRLIKQLDDLRAETRSTETVMRSERIRLKRIIRNAHQALQRADGRDLAMDFLAIGLADSKANSDT